jgi:hypothetical protein
MAPSEFNNGEIRNIRGHQSGFYQYMSAPFQSWTTYSLVFAQKLLTPHMAEFAETKIWERFDVAVWESMSYDSFARSHPFLLLDEVSESPSSSLIIIHRGTFAA